MQVFTSLLVLSIFFGIFIITDIKSYKQRKVESVFGLAQVLGTNSISAIQFQDNETARKMLRELQNVAPDIDYAGILDKSGKLFADYSKTGSDSIHLPASLGRKNSVFTAKRLYIIQDIISENELTGKVVLVVNLVELKQLRSDKIKLAIVLVSFAFALSVLIAFIIQSYISKRLLHLVNTMEAVSRTGDYSKSIKDDGKDEISILIRAFDNLMREVEESQQRKDEFIGIASHELKTPLTSIKGYLDLLSLIEEKQPNKQFVGKALANVHKLEMLIKDLLDVSKIQQGQLELNMKEFNIDNLVDETISSIQMVSGSHEIMRVRNFNNEMVAADRMRIEQVLTNLLSNAIKYSPGESKVIVESDKTDTELIIKIKDYGIGVAKEEQANIFERFYRTRDVSITITGFGLGLYICRDIIQRHKGRIWVEREDKGSAFYFSLPLKAEAGLESS